MSEKMSKTLRTTDAEWRRVLSINLDSTFLVVNELVPPMAEARAGRVVIFSACLGRMSGPGNAGGLAPYRISKAGVNALVRNLAHETGMGARGLLVDAICPNHSRTDMGGPDALRSAEEGAETALWLLNRSFNHQSENEIERTTGVLWEDHRSPSPSYHSPDELHWISVPELEFEDDEDEEIEDDEPEYYVPQAQLAQE
jgi:NAD(P)-dependent dehydrogenase (short-subunit alcohol dehydrogenase family)